MDAAVAAASAPAPPPQSAVRGKSAADQRAAKKELQKIERQLDRISDKETTLHAQIAENATDFARVAELDAELRELTGERDELETALAGAGRRRVSRRRLRRRAAQRAAGGPRRRVRADGAWQQSRHGPVSAAR